MKKGSLFFILLLSPFFLKATNYISTSSGNWSNSAIWSPNGIPGSGDNVVIATSVTVNGNDNVNNITINASQALTVSGSNTLTIYGTFINNGTFSPGIGTVSFYATSNDTIGGTTSTSFYNVNFRDLTSNVVKYLTSNINVQGSLTLYPGGTLNMNGKNITIAGNWINNIVAGQGNFISGNETVTFNGSSTQTIGGTTTTTFPNLVISPASTVQLGVSTTVNDNLTILGTFNLSSSNYLLTISGNFTNNGTFNAGNGTVSLFAEQNDLVGGTSPISFYNLIIRVYNYGTFTESLASNITILGSLTINPGGNLNMNGKNITIAGNWTNNCTTGTFTGGSGSVIFNGSTTQVIGGTTATVFTNLTSASTSTVQLGIGGTTVSKNFTISSGIFDCQTYKIIGNATGIFSMAANTFLLLGTTASATNSLFPTGFTAGNITLNATSTVEYLANTGTQTISVTPSSYGNLIVDAGSSVTKRLSGSPLIISGNLTINSNPTLSAAANTINLTGNLTNNGTISFSTGALNIAGNFTNNGTYVSGTGTATMKGALGQLISGSTSTTFYNLTINGSSAETVTLGDFETVSNNFVINAGSFDVSASNYGLTIGGNWTNNSGVGAFISRTGTVTLSGASGQTIGGTVSTTFYNLTAAGIGSETVTLGNTVNISNDFLLSGGFMDVSALSYGLTVGGNWINNSGAAAFIPRTGTITLIGSTGQTIGGTASTTFYNLTAAGTGAETVTLGNSETISNNLLISAGTFDVSASNYSLVIGGNLTTNGSLNTRSGSITFNGSGQAIGGTTAISFYDFTINETSSTQTVTINTNESFQDALTMTTGTLASGGSHTLTLLSNATRTARIAQIVTPANTNITANFVVQRYLASRVTNQPNYAAFSSPVQAAQTIMNWNDSNRTLPNRFYMSGIGGPDGNASGYVSVMLFDETQNSGNANYVPITHYASPGNTYVVTPGQGIYLWLGTSLSTMSDPFTYITNGVPSIAQLSGISVNVTNSGASKGNGFNLIGNPFCSPIDWVTFQAANPSLSTTFALMQGDGSWHHYTSGSIAMEQGFGVTESNPSATITFQESHKTALDAGLERGIKPLMEPADEPNAITFTLSDDANNFSSPATITFGSNYLTAYSPQKDALFIQSLTPGVPQLSSISAEGYKLSVYRLPDTEKKLTVPVNIVGQVDAQHTITVSGLDNITSYQCVNLVDASTGEVLNNFNTNSSYSFNLTQNENIRNYSIQFIKLSGAEDCNKSTPVAATENAGNIKITPTNNGALVKFNLPEETDMNISVCNILGQKIMNDITGTAYVNQFPITLKEGQLYIIRVQTPNGVITKKLYR